jgi:hypothetical protein
MNTLISQPLESNTDHNQSSRFNIVEYLKRLGDRIVEYFNSQSEIKVWQRQDRFGNEYWEVYDPNTHRSASFDSEEEVRIWIEELFHQQQYNSVYQSSAYDYHRSNAFR